MDDDITVQSVHRRKIANLNGSLSLSEWANSGRSSKATGQMASNPISPVTLPRKGRVFSILSEDPRSPLHWLAMVVHEFGTPASVFTRLSPQRLSQHIDLQKIEFKWLSESMDSHALSPSLERIHHSISTRIVSDSGIIWLDAVEYLIHRQGFDAFLAFTRSLADELNGTQWTVLLPFTPLSLDGTEIAHLRREAMPFEIGQLVTEAEVVSNVEDSGPEQVEEVVQNDVDDEAETAQVIEESSVVMLSTIAEAALTPAVLSRRIKQWVDMGFDVSSLEHSLNSDGTKRYEIYREVEENVRRAVECERRIQMIEIRGHTVEAAKMRFRIMQLTGIGDVEAKLDQLLSGSS